jgi:hypothetical protein
MLEVLNLLPRDRYQIFYTPQTKENALHFYISPADPVAIIDHTAKQENISPEESQPTAVTHYHTQCSYQLTTIILFHM